MEASAQAVAADPRGPGERVAFIRKHRIVLSTGRCSLPTLAEAVAGRPLRGSWMANPEVFRIYRILKAVSRSRQVITAPLILGKETLRDVSRGSPVARIAADPGAGKPPSPGSRPWLRGC